MSLDFASISTASTARSTTWSTSTVRGSLERLVVLQPGELDDLLHQPVQPGRLGLHPRGEPQHRLRVVGGLLHRLGEQGEGADRRLQLVGDVGDEVTPDRLYATLPGAVLDQHQHQPVAQRGHPGVRRGRGSTGRAGDVQVDLAGLAVAAYEPDQVAQRLEPDLAVAHQPQGVRRRRRLQRRCRRCRARPRSTGARSVPRRRRAARSRPRSVTVAVACRGARDR